MKSQLTFIILALLAIVIGAKADVTINSENFPDANFRSFLLSQDYGKDGKLTDSEIANITSLSVPVMGIQSLRGIKYFTALKALFIYRNIINENEMEHLVRELPVQSGATLYPYYLGATDERNYMSMLQVQTANAKGWNVLMWQNTDIGEYLMPMVQYPSSILFTYITPEYFPDENFRNALKEKGIGNFYIEGQPYLTTEDVSVKMLNVERKNITSLKGIEYFTALEFLNCTSNHLTSLDVSKNTTLSLLGCGDNQLTTLDLSKNTALEVLDCSINQLTSLDLSKNTELTGFSCAQNKLTSLDVSKNKKLTALYCYQNQIKGDKMDALIASLPNNTTDDTHYFYVNYNSSDEGNVITTAQILDVKQKHWTPCWYNGNGFEPYEVSIAINKENFPDEAFRNYLLSQDYGKDGKLTEEEIKAIAILFVNEKGIRSLKGIEYFTALVFMSCSSNYLTSLDVSKNTTLSLLGCAGNKLTTLDLSKNTALEVLDCSHNQLTSLDLSKNKVMKGLDCGYNHLKTLDVSSNTALTELYCYGNEFTNLDVSKNTELRELACYDNKLTSLLVTRNKKLKSLACYLNQIKDTDMDILIASLPQNDTDEELKFVVVSNLASEGNVCTPQQVLVAMNRGWTPYYYDYQDNKEKLYNGKIEVIFKKGDVNLDGAIDVADISTIIDVMAGSAGVPSALADVNGDGSVDVADISTVIDIMATK